MKFPKFLYRFSYQREAIWNLILPLSVFILLLLTMLVRFVAR